MNASILHDREAGRFSLEVTAAASGDRGAGRGDSATSATAFLQYEDDGSVWDIVETFTPPAARGRGIAERLAQAAFAAAAKAERRILPSCSYISGAFLAKNPALSAQCVARGEPEPAAAGASGADADADDGDDADGAADMGDDAVDLSIFLAPLSRDQLELLCMQMMARVPEPADAAALIFAACEAPVGALEARSAVEMVLGHPGDAGEATEPLTASVVRELAPLVQRARAYVRAGARADAVGGDPLRSATTLLDCVSDALVEAVCARDAAAAAPKPRKRRRTDDEGDDSLAAVQPLLVELEQAWEALFAAVPAAAAPTAAAAASATASQGAMSFDGDEWMYWFKRLAQWRQRLSRPSAAALFSDALRVCKQRLQTLGAGGQM